MQKDDNSIELLQNIVLPDIDKITLECFMNRTRYNKYVAKTDPKRSAETEKYLANVKKYRDKIKGLTGDLLDDPTMPITTEVNEMFDAYMKTLIKHFETKELERGNEYNNYNCDNNEEETLFGQMDDDDRDLTGVSPKMTSFWSGERIIKRR